VRQATDILHEIGRHLAGSVSAQRESIDAPTKAAVDCGDDLIVSAHRREEMGYVIWHLLRHLAPPSLPGQSIELVAEVFNATRWRTHSKRCVTASSSGPVARKPPPEIS